MTALSRESDLNWPTILFILILLVIVLIPSSNLAEAQSTKARTDLSVNPENIIFSDDSPKEGESITITIVIENNGETDLNNILVSVMIDDKVLAHEIIEFLRSKDSSEMKLNWSAEEGRHTVKVFIDPNNEIEEVDELNNHASKSIDVEKRLDFRIIFVAGTIFVIAYVIIVTERIHRAVVAMGGAIVMLFAGIYLGFFNQHEAFNSIDFNTLGLLLGMMIIVGVLMETGFFEYIAIKTFKKAKGRMWEIMLLFSVVTAILSASLDNVTTVLLIAPVTISLAVAMKVNPVPFLIAEILASNIGGAATLVGDPPNIMIGSQAHITFNEFIIYLAPIVIIVFLVSLLMVEVIFRKELRVKVENIDKIMAMDERKEIKHRSLLRKSLFVLGFTITLFVFHDTLGLEPSIVALTGASLLLLISLLHPDVALRRVEWSTLVFFAGLFVIVGGIEHAGIIELLAEGALALTGGNLILALLVIIWVAALASAIVDNIPFTAAMIPLIFTLEKSFELGDFAINPMWWALALGACLGGNGTLIGASANVVVAGISERQGHPISFIEFTKIGMVVMAVTVTIATVLMILFTMFIWPLF